MVLADAVARGFYSKAIAPWTEVFGSDRLLVLQYEKCVIDTSGQLARTFDHLGLTEYHVSPSERPIRPEPVARPPLEADASERLVALYRRDVEQLARLVPDLDLTLWPQFDHLDAMSETPSPGAGTGDASSTSTRWGAGILGRLGVLAHGPAVVLILTETPPGTVPEAMQDGSALVSSGGPL